MTIKTEDAQDTPILRCVQLNTHAYKLITNYIILRVLFIVLLCILFIYFLAPIF